MEVQVRPNRRDGEDPQALLSRNAWLRVGGSKTEPTWDGVWGASLGTPPFPALLLLVGWRHFPTLSFCLPDFYSSKRRIVPDKPKPDKPRL